MVTLCDFQTSQIPFYRCDTTVSKTWNFDTPVKKRKKEIETRRITCAVA
jgi:hypothetical protein